uniref:PDZ domain-containing protein n=1 Tax=Biomphalaria glabrata TaxID=6526 RepID=A0A2C9L2T6_BIOGL
MNIPVDIPDASATVMVNDSVRIMKSPEHTNQKIAIKGIDISFKSPSQEINLKPTQPLEALSKENVAKPKETHSRDNKMDAMSAVNLELNKEQTLPTTDAVSSVFQIPYIQSFSEIDDDPWKDYSALEFGGLSKESPGIKGEFEPMKINTSDLDTNWMLRTTDTADRTTSLPPDHVAPPVPRVRSKLGLYSESVDISKLPATKISSIKNEETPSQSDHENSEYDSDIYADGTSESNVEQSKEEALKVIVPQLSLKLERVSAQGEEPPEDHENDGSKETTNETRDYDHVPVRMRKLVNAKPVFPGLVMSASPTTTSPTASEVFFTKRSTKGPHSGGPEYAQPWEEKKLETLAPSSAALPSETIVTTSSRSSSEPSSGKGSFSGARLSYTSEDMNEEIGFGMGDAHRLNRIDPNTSTKAKTKHKVPEDESKKGNRLKSLTSLFHRKKKEKKDTNHSDEDDNEDDNESNDDDDVSDTKDNEGKTKKRKSDKHKKEKSEKPKKPKKPSKSEKNQRLSQEVEPENVEMTDSNWRPLCRLLKINDDGSRVLEMSRPQSEPLGIFFKKGPETHKEGLVVKSFLDKHAKRLFAGLLRIGDEIVEIDDEDICHLTLDEIKDLIQQKESMVLSLRSTEGTL